MRTGVSRTSSSPDRSGADGGRQAMSQEQSSTTRDLGGGPLRILQINSSISRRSGVMSVLMNYLRHMAVSYTHLTLPTILLV